MSSKILNQLWTGSPFQQRLHLHPLGSYWPNPKGPPSRIAISRGARGFKHFVAQDGNRLLEWVVRFLKFHKKQAGDWAASRDLGSRGA